MYRGQVNYFLTLRVGVMDIPNDYIIADGPEGLIKVLNELLEKSKNDSTFAQQKHYVLYQLGNQKSMLRVDTDKGPFTFWHYDLMGRPATQAIKETIANFLREHWGEEEQELLDVTHRNGEE